jgi:hypothetical protein
MQSPAKQQKYLARAIKFFYPTRKCWGGYAKFFEPSIPSRIGDLLVTNIHLALKRRDQDAIASSVLILSQSHVKNVKIDRGLVAQVTCFPTKEARRAVKLLKKLQSE